MLQVAYLEAVDVISRQDRRILDGMFSEGVMDQTSDFVLAIGGILSPTVSAGHAIVEGDDNALQGKYSVVNTSSVSVAIANNPSGNPQRIDRIVLRVRDLAENAGAGAPVASVEAITGTPIGTAQMSDPLGSGYLAGVAAEPPTALTIGFAQVQEGSVIGILNAAPSAIRRKWQTVEEWNVCTPTTGLATGSWLMRKDSGAMIPVGPFASMHLTVGRTDINKYIDEKNMTPAYRVYMACHNNGTALTHNIDVWSGQALPDASPGGVPYVTALGAAQKTTIPNLAPNAGMEDWSNPFFIAGTQWVVAMVSPGADIASGQAVMIHAELQVLA